MPKKRTHKEFINLLAKVRNDLNVIGTYKTIRVPILVKDSDGIQYMMRPDLMLKLKKTRIDEAIDKTHYFKIKVMTRFPNLKMLSKYINAATHILVEDENGFQYLTKPLHISKGNYPSIRLAVDKKKALQREVNKYQLGITVKEDYKGMWNKILVEDELGIEYLVPPATLYVGSKPTIYIAVDKNKCFSIKAMQIHGDKYSYEFVNYIKSYTKIKILCPIHGIFEQLPNAHLEGHECKKCADVKAVQSRETCGFSKTQWIEACKNKATEPSLYVINCYNEDESFVKIGITSKKVNARFFGINMSYIFNIIHLHSNNPEYIYDKEKELHKQFKEYKYKPKMKFNGYTECFNLSILNELKTMEVFAI